MKRIGLTLVLLALLLAACGGSESTTAGASTSSGGNGEPAAVTIEDFEFDPATITVAAGTTVRFTNEDSSPHTATSKQSGAFDTGTIKQGESATVKLDEPGTYAFFCAFHPFMKGTIEVE
ncbi:MAG TPA: cupredoxin family copper-binding protein [Solirubrobacterales bacterium]|nr:cupredoxin family copper-binding protein [Solirubrobacterales bacterium]